jgi:tetratricopeptide (TPR) repeat protein
MHTRVTPFTVNPAHSNPKSFFLLFALVVFFSGCGPSNDSPESDSDRTKAENEAAPDSTPNGADETAGTVEAEVDLEPILAMVREGDFDAAERELRAEMERDDNLPPYRAVLGYVLAERGDLEGSLAQFEANIADQPGVGENYFNAGSVLRRMGRAADALEFYAKAGELGAATPEIVAYNERLALIEMGRADELVEETATQLDVENPPGDWIMTAAAISLSRGYVAEGAKHLSMAREKIHPRFFADLAKDRFFRQYRSHPEIVEVLTPPENQNPYLAQAVMALRNNDFPTVVEAAEAAVKAGEPASESRTLQGIALLRMEELQAAEAAFNAAIEADPTIAGGYLNLGELFRATGRNEEAVAIYQKAAEIQPDNPRIQLKIALATLEAEGSSDVEVSEPAAQDALALARALHAGDDQAAAAALAALKQNHPEPWLRTVFTDSFFRQQAENPALAGVYTKVPGTSPTENDPAAPEQTDDPPSPQTE